MQIQIYARDWLVPHVQGQEGETTKCGLKMLVAPKLSLGW